MFRAMIIRIDDSVLLEQAQIQAQNARRGFGDGHIWRGMFSLPAENRRPRPGETICLRLDDNSRICGVVTEIDGLQIHFRARGKAPTGSPLMPQT